MAHRGSGASLRSTSLAIEIVDLYHAREHLTALSKLVYGVASAKAREWATARLAQLDEGDVESLLLSLRRLRPTAAQTQEAVRQAIGYFDGNRERMRYAKFRRQQLFVGSGVIEAAAKPLWVIVSSNPVCVGACVVLTPSSRSVALN